MLNPVTPSFVEALRARLPDAAFREDVGRYLSEPRGRWQGQAGLVVAPGGTDEVAAVLALAHAERVPVIPYGGGTGLVGGQIAESGPAPVLLTLERMTAVRAVYPAENTLVAEGGAILADLHAAADEAGRVFPLTLASQGSARIGGLLATNAGGVNVLRYGNARDLCLGLEVVMADGTVWNGLSRLRKNNTGYDLRHLMIGSEGTLGVITAAALRLHPRPAGEGTAMLAVRDPAAALELLSLAGDRMAEGVSAFEIIHRQGLDFLAETGPEVRVPFAEPPEWMVLIEVGLPRGLDPAAALEALFEEAAERGLVQDGVIARSEQQRSDLWAIRENIPEANRRIGSVSSHDISVPVGSIPEFIARGAEVIGRIGDFRINCFGHLGDGNLHYNVFPQPGRSRQDHLAEREAIKRAVHDLVHEMDGSVSAEHGIGRLKVDDLERYGDPAKLAAMRAIKGALDPRGILNPGAVLRV